MVKDIEDVPKPDAADIELSDDELASVSGGVGGLANGGATLSPGKGVASSCPRGSLPPIGDIEGVKF